MILEVEGVISSPRDTLKWYFGTDTPPAGSGNSIIVGGWSTDSLFAIFAVHGKTFTGSEMRWYIGERECTGRLNTSGIGAIQSSYYRNDETGWLWLGLISVL